MSGFFIFASPAFFLWLTGGAMAQQGAAGRDLAEESAPAKSGAALVEAMKAYGASLETVLKLYDAEFKKRAEEVQARRGYYEKGYIARVELEAAQRELAAVEARLRETEQKIAEVKIGLAEATALERLSKLAPLKPGEYTERASWIRYAGRGPWSLRGAAAIEKFFLERFGRPAPISALGQTAFHERMRLDHREAMDVALHPDSAEGRSLIDFLRRSGVPFIAFRNGVPGSASGAHIHVGRPSLRLNSR